MYMEGKINVSYSVNSYLLADSKIQQPGYDLSQQQWSLLNYFCISQGHYEATEKRWRLPV